jgi:hypothetical protein
LIAFREWACIAITLQFEMQRRLPTLVLKLSFC